MKKYVSLILMFLLLLSCSQELSKESGTSTIDKVKVAGVIAEKISLDKILEVTEKDEYLNYLFKSIKHACRKK